MAFLWILAVSLGKVVHVSDGDNFACFDTEDSFTFRVDFRTRGELGVVEFVWNLGVWTHRELTGVVAGQER